MKKTTSKDLAQTAQTKNKVIDAVKIFAKTPSEVSFDDLKVSQICEAAGLSRQAFYNNFADKYEIALWHTERIARASIYKIGTAYTWYEGQYLLSACLLKEKYLSTYFGKSENYNAAPQTIRRQFKEQLLAFFSENGRFALSEKLIFEINCIARASCDAGKRWVIHGMKITPQQFAEFQDGIIPPDLIRLQQVPPNHAFGSKPLSADALEWIAQQLCTTDEAT